MAKSVVHLLTFLTLIISANQALTSDINWHHLEIGFNLDYPDRVHLSETALNEIKQLGIHDIYIHEIFDGQYGNEYQIRLKSALDRLLKHGMRPMICISNIHASLQPTGEFKKQLIKAIPSNVARKVEKHLTYTNRFPPNDWQAYQKSIQGLLDFLFSTYGYEHVKEWYFEIGNEPDAPLFYWGNPEQYAELVNKTIKVLHQNEIHNIGGLGLTHHSIFLNDSGRNPVNLEYHNLLKNILCTTLPDGFISFHLFREKLNTPLKGLPEWLKNSQCRVMITGWNISSQGNVLEKLSIKPGAWGRAFIRLLADCSRYGIDRLYIFKLMDYPLQKTLQLGIFDKNGKPKPWYTEFKEIWNVVRKGYRVIEKEDSLAIIGVTGRNIILPLSTTIKVNSPIVYSPSGFSNTTKEIKPEDWIIISTEI